MFYILFFSSVVVGFFIGKIIFKVAYRDIVKKDTEAKILKECTNLIKKQEIEKEKLSSIKEEILKEESKLNQKIDDSSIILRIKQDELEKEYNRKKENYIKEIEEEIEDWARSAQEAATINRNYKIEEFNEEIINKEKELNNLKDEIKDFQAKREVINQEILRQREMEEKQDFYKIQIDEASKQDIAFLLSIIDRFNNKEIIYKLIWSEYIQRPFKNMLDRVLSNKNPKNVIYMIKNMDTEEIYIGKTKAEVSKRWTEHIKTSLNIGTISKTKIHKALFNNWDKFSFTVLEEVPIENNLGDREKYYIRLYESDIFGYNIKSGG